MNWLLAHPLHPLPSGRLRKRKAGKLGPLINHSILSEYGRPTLYEFKNNTSKIVFVFWTSAFFLFKSIILLTEKSRRKFGSVVNNVSNSFI
jgi:hypothetical protein